MKNTILKITTFSVICLVTLSLGASALAWQAPIANAGPDLNAQTGQSVTLQGSGSDPDGGSVTFLWACTTSGVLSSYNVAQPTFTTPSFAVQNQYGCTVKVTDTEGLSATDRTIIRTAFVQNVGGNNVRTSSATNISNTEATLNGFLAAPNLYNSSSVWFEYGTTTNYEKSTNHQNLTSGSFAKNIVGLLSQTTYHFRTVSENSSNNIIYGEDRTFYTSGTGSVINSFLVSKKVINLTVGNLNSQSSVNASPNDVLSFSIILQAPFNQSINNIVVHDILPANLIYTGNLTINASLSNSGIPANGINIGTIQAGEIVIIAYQAKVAPTENFAYGTTTLTNTATVTSTEAGSQTANSSVIVNKSFVSGASIIGTGLTNNLLTDSFFLPLLLIVLGMWLYFSRKTDKLADWIKSKI